MADQEQLFVKRLSLFYAFAVTLLAFGLMGLALGVWAQLYRPSTPGELMINKTLILFSLALCISATIHFASFWVIKKMSGQKA